MYSCYPIAIWHARKTIYDEIFQRSLSIIATINSLIDELGISRGNQKLGTGYHLGKLCEESLDLAEDCGIKKTTVASDCLNAIKNIKEMARCSYMMIIHSINMRSRSFDYVRFAHEGRESNQEDHYLAKRACTFGPGRHVWLEYPPIFWM
uniref:RNase H type-1 domain-containing protein n=1 Tax=Setaria italica TaxID=4555 RepID=K4ALN8_SETIT